MSRDPHVIEGELDAANTAVGLGRPGAAEAAARLQAELDEATAPVAGKAEADEVPSEGPKPRRRKRQ